MEIDEEASYSSVYRGLDDIGYGEEENILLHSDKTEMQGGTSGSGVNSPYFDFIQANHCHLTSSTSECGGLSPSASTSPLSSEKSSLNPQAKEFKFNPDARNFVPSQSALRPASPVSEGPFFFPTNVPGVAYMPIGIGIGNSFGAHQPVSFNPPVALQGYFLPGAPQYGQHMIVGQRPFVYMPAYWHINQSLSNNRIQ